MRSLLVGEELSPLFLIKTFALLEAHRLSFNLGEY
jgi:hypothetical protein